MAIVSRFEGIGYFFLNAPYVNEDISDCLLGTPGDWGHITEQKGMFCILGLTPAQVNHLQSK